MSLIKKQSSKLQVTEAQYWEKYYEHPNKNYEWNNGYLEEKNMSNYYTVLMYDWFLDLLKYYFRTYHNGNYTYLEMGFRLSLANKVAIRKPDLGVVMEYNPDQLKGSDRSYQGIFDLCVEALSDSDKNQIIRDTVVKKQEYAQAGVKEYYILYEKDNYIEFYQLEQGKYIPMSRQEGDIIHSKVLPGFQFRMSDLYHRPDVKEMVLDPVYQSFVFLDYQKLKQKVYIAEQEVRIEKRKNAIIKQKLNIANKKIESEKQKTVTTEQKLKHQLLKFEALCKKHNLPYK